MKILIGGSPCTHWSIAQTKNRETEASGIGWELFLNYRIVRDKYKPDFFLYENNKSMSPAIRAQITAELGVEPVLINSALVSAKNRQRLYWAGKRNPDGTYSQVDVEQPVDRGILLRDILESGVCWCEKSYTLKANYTNAGAVNGVCGQHFPAPMAAEPVRIGTIENEAKNQDYDSQQYRVYSPDGKSVTLCGNGGGLGAKTGLYAVPVEEPVNTTVDGKAQCLRATYYKDGIRNMVCNTVDRKTCVAVRIGAMPNQDGEVGTSQSRRIYSVEGKSVPLQARPNGGGADGAATGLYAVPAPVEYEPLHSCDVVITDQNIRCTYKDGSGTAQGYTVTFDNMKAPSVIAGHARKMKIIERARGKKHPSMKCAAVLSPSYVFPVSPTQAYKMLGNGWTVDVIAHIMSHFDGLTAEPVEVLSMYDGMSCGHIALDKLGAQITTYYATEIDKYAIQTTQHNFPNTVQLGDAFQVRADNWALPAAGEEATENGGNCIAG